MVAASEARAQSTIGAQSPAKRACEAALARGIAQARQAARVGPRGALGSYFAHNGCYASGAVAWLLLVDHPQFRRVGSTVELQDGALTVTHFAANGSVIRGDAALLGEHTRVGDRVMPRAAQIADFDDDGAAELVVYERRRPHQRPTILSARDGAVRAYGGAVPLAFDELTSMTLGAQLDMVQHVVHELPEACEATLGRTRTALSFVAIRSGATFQADGDEARAWARAQCPERPAVIVPQHGVQSDNAARVWTEVVRRAACARVWGMSPEAIERVVPSRWPAALSCTNAANLVAWTRTIQPPFVLRPMPEVRPSPAAASTHVQYVERDDWGRDFDDADFAAPIRAYAAAQSRRLNATLNQITRQSQGSITIDELQEFFSMFGRALPGSPRDAWINSVDRLAIDNPNDEPFVTGATRIAHINASGRVAFDRATPLERRYESSSLRYVINAFDYDGDGSSEAFVRFNEAESEVGGSAGLSILTARGGVVREYQPAGGVPLFERIIDVDEDGRPDLVSSNKYAVSFESDEELRGSILIVAHARADGTFSTDDAQAREFVESQCTAPPERLVVFNPDEDDAIDTAATLSAVVCARFYGERAERIVARINADARSLDEPQLGYLRSIAEAALWRMPYQLGARSLVTQRP